MIFRQILLIAALFVVSGCTLGSPPEAVTGESSPTEETTPEQPIAARTPAKDAVARRQPIEAPSRLDGLSGEQVATLLGAPSFKRHDSPAQVWQYGGGSCLLDVFLYENKGKETLTVAHSEARGHNGAKITYKDCIARLIEEKRRALAG